MRRIFHHGLFLLVLIASASPALAADARIDSLIVKTQNGDKTLKLEVAANEAEWEKGLMYRKSLDKIDGMLFLFTGNEQHAMWMMNTYIPLDILFISKAGVITTIHKNAKPQDLTPLPSKGPAKGAIELNAGAVAELGIAVGDTVTHPYFGG